MFVTIFIAVISLAALILSTLASAAPLSGAATWPPDSNGPEATAPTPVIRHDTVDDRGLLVPLPVAQETASHLTQLQGFTLVTVIVVVQDDTGAPVQNAAVKAFSEDWGVRYPFNWTTFYTTDSQGRVACRLPAGDWTFFAGGGDAFRWGRPGHGLFAVQRTTINTSTTVTLRPDSTLTLTLRDVNGSVLDADEVYLMESSHMPRVPFPIVGRTQSGQIILHTTSAAQYDLLLLKRPTTAPGYFLHFGPLSASGAIDVRPTRSELALIHLHSYDRLNQPGTLNVCVTPAWWDMDRLHGFFDFSINGQAELYVTPQWLRLHYRNLSQPDWYYYFVGKHYNLQAGSEMTYNMGGPLSVTVKALGKDTETQLWLLVEDAFDNQMDGFNGPGGVCSIPITLTRQGDVLYTDTLTGLGGRIEQGYAQANSPQYLIDLNLGPLYGRWDLTGTLLSAETAYGWQITNTAHFTLHTPYGFPAQKAALATELEAAYTHLSTYLGEDLLGNINVYIEPWPSSAGWGGTNVMQAWLGGFSWHHPQWPAGIFEPVLWHELGHVFQFTPPLLYAVECAWFCEPFATYLGAEVIEALQGRPLAEWHLCNHVDFFRYLEGGQASEVERMQFILYDLRRVFGRDIHREFVHWWADSSYPPARQALTGAGFGVREIVAVLYSHLANQNLGWLFRMGGVTASDQRIAEGLAIVEGAVSPTPDVYGFIIDGRDSDWVRYSPASIDPQGDSQCGAGTDLTAFYFASTPDYLYIMQQVADGRADLGWFHFHINVPTNGGTYHYYVDLTSGWSQLFDETAQRTVAPVPGAARTVAESRIPWALLGLPAEVEMWPVAPGPPCDGFSNAIVIPRPSGPTPTPAHSLYLPVIRKDAGH